MGKIFEVIGLGAFAKAMRAMISSHGGIAQMNDPLNMVTTSAEWSILCIPSYYLQNLTFDQSRKYIFVSKGMVGKLLPTEFAATSGLRYMFVSGPHLASEIAEGFPTTTTVAGDLDGYNEIQMYFDGPRHSPSTHFICLASVIKNIIAYMCGFTHSMGENFRASMLTSGLREMTAIARSLSLDFLDSDLFQAGVISDLILTGSTLKSRNFTAGVMMAQGKPVTSTTESIHSAKLLTDRIGYDYTRWPIVSCAAHVITENKLPEGLNLVDLV